MNKGIVITTSEYTKDFLKECLDSLPNKYPILVVSNGGYIPQIKPNEPAMLLMNDWNGFELGGISRGAEVFGEFVHLMDTCIVHNPVIFDVMFTYPDSVHLSRGFYSYLGKYKKEILNQIGIPRIENKEEAIAAEHHWGAEYLRADKNAMQFMPELPVESDVFEEKHGRKNMVLSNGFITKYKGTWR
jgi:hypothetical protein